LSKRKRLIGSIAGTIADYRAGEIEPPTPEHVDSWVKQFDGGVQEPMLEELDYVLKETYYSRATVEEFLAKLVRSKKLTGEDPCSFWRSVRFLNIQDAGNSQREMLQILDALVRTECGPKTDEEGQASGPFVYLDDGIFTGNRIKNDLTSWIRSAAAPEQAKVHVVTIALHRGGQYYANTGLERSALETGKKIDVQWWRALEVEDRKTSIDSSDVLRPIVLPDDEVTQEYAKTLKYPIAFRKPGSVGENKFYSSEAGRHLLEQELLKAGARIRSMCPHLNVYQRPLGNMVLETLGFGALLVTFRNCPNNCPLAFWAGDPWYPLFPRKTN